jgi:hypothetical protein
MAQPQSIYFGICSELNIAANETSNTSTQNTQLQPQAQKPQGNAADMATKNMHNEEMLIIVYKSTAKTNKQTHAVECMLFNYIT